MGPRDKLQLGPLEGKLNNMRFPITISDLGRDDDPLVFVNDAFVAVTGYGDESLGQNCRFLQGDLENDAARAEVREALAQGHRTQVVFHNRRNNGERFYNLLMLDLVTDERLGHRFAVGSQFDLGPNDPDVAQEDVANASPELWDRVINPTIAIKLERRRVVAESAVRMVRSWLMLTDTRRST